jgi:hypothetical protein
MLMMLPRVDFGHYSVLTKSNYFCKTMANVEIDAERIRDTTRRHHARVL